MREVRYFTAMNEHATSRTCQTILEVLLILAVFFLHGAYPVPDSNEAAVHRLQNWRDWLTRGLIDVVCPMAYTTNAEVFNTQIAAARDLAPDASKPDDADG